MKSEGGILSMVLISFLTYVYFFSFTPFLSISSLGLSMCVFTFLLFVRKLGNTIPILELILLMACLQWVLGPFLAYWLGNNHYKYYMSIPEEEYMSYIIPSIFFFGLGMMAFRGQIGRYQRKVLESLNSPSVVSKRIPFYLIVVGLLAHVAVKYAPDSLKFVFFLLDGLQFIAVIYFFQTRHKFKWHFFILVFSINVSISLAIAMFHNLLIWSALLFVFVSLYVKIGYVAKLALIGMGMMSAFYIQSVKKEYREVVWQEDAEEETQEATNAEIFTEMVMERVEEEESMEDESFLEMMNTRLNQGWIISRVMYYVPFYEPYAKGETIKDAVNSSLLPRFLAPDKKKAGGKEIFERFTGYVLQDTSMNVSILGEAYANFGFLGSRIFMFFWGVFMAFVLLFMLKMTKKYPTFWIWIPLIFSQAIKAETDVLTVMNHLVKSIIFVVAIFYGINSILKMKI